MSAIKTFLDNIHFNYLSKIAKGSDFDNNPFPSKDVIETNISSLDDKTKKIIRFLCCGEAIFKEQLNSLFPKSFISELRKNELLLETDVFVCLRGCSFVSYNGLYILADSPYYYSNAFNTKEDVYLGPDSYKIKYFLTEKRNYEECLDLCCGSGIQGMLASQISNVKNITFVDINKKALKFLNQNLIINGIKKCNLLHKSIFDSFNKKYDLIVCNPPFVPIAAHNDWYPISGNGGLDGTLFLKRLFEISSLNLNHNGRSIISGESFLLDNDEPYFINDLKEILKTGFTINLFLTSNISIDTFIKNLSSFCLKAFKKQIGIDDYKDLIEKKVKGYGRFILVIDKKSTKRKSSIRIVKTFNTISDSSMFIYKVDPKRVIFKECKEKTFYLIYGNKIIAQVDEEAKLFIESHEKEISGADIAKDKIEETRNIIDALIRCGIIKER